MPAHTSTETQPRPQKPPRWVSPWSFDDEWEDEQKKHLPQPDARPSPEQKPASVPSPVAPRVEKLASMPESVVVQPAAPEPPAPQPAAAVVAPRPRTAPMIVSRAEEPVKPGLSDDWVDLDALNASPANLAGMAEPEAADEDDERFRPPPEKRLHPSAPASTVLPPLRFTDVPAATAGTKERPRAQSPQPARQSPPEPERTQMDAAQGSAFSAYALGFLGICGALLLGWIYLADAPPPLDHDLLETGPVDTAPKIAAPERLTTFLNAVIAIPDMEVALRPPWRWDPKTLEDYVRANGAALDGLRDLLGDFDWHPQHAAWHLEDHAQHISWPHVRILLQARVARLLLLGDENAALDAALDIGRLSARLHDMVSWPGYLQRAQELHMACMQTCAQVLRQTRLSSAELKPHQEAFSTLAPQDAQLQRALSAFYLHEKKLLFGEASGAPLDTMPEGRLSGRPGRLFFKKQETLGLFAHAFRSLRDQVAITPGAARQADRTAALRGRPAKALNFQPNAEGERYYAQKADPSLDMVGRHHLAKARHDLVLCLFAVRRYVADHQKLPSGLSDLRPDYLPDIPMDPFSTEPMRYDAIRGLIFSAGENLIAEDGHVTEPALADPGEPTVDTGIIHAPNAR